MLTRVDVSGSQEMRHTVHAMCDTLWIKTSAVYLCVSISIAAVIICHPPVAQSQVSTGTKVIDLCV